MFIKLYESALFLKYYNVKLHINTKYFGETLEGTGQAEDYRLKLSPKKASQQYGVIKKPVNEFVKTHLLAISLGFMSQTLYCIKKTIRYAYGSEKVSPLSKNASLRAKIYIGQPTKYSTRGDAI